MVNFIEDQLNWTDLPDAMVTWLSLIISSALLFPALIFSSVA